MRAAARVAIAVRWGARARQRGSAAVLFGLLLVVLCGFVALAVDAGHLFKVRAELQNAADAAALAGVRDLNGTTAHFAAARAASQAYAQANGADGTPVTVSASDVILGNWNFATRSFTPLLSPAPQVNAVKVTANRTGAENGAVGTFFAPLVGEKDWYGDEERATAAKYRALLDVVKRYLKSPKVVRVGRRKVAVYVVGTASEGGWAGLKTTAVET